MRTGETDRLDTLSKWEICFVREGEDGFCENWGKIELSFSKETVIMHRTNI